MKLINFQLGLTITIEEDLIEKLKYHAKTFYPNEFGGLLIGTYSADKTDLLITDTILPINFKSTKVEFSRETKDLRETINFYFEQVPSKFYVGEWHTHPNGFCTPSRTDINALMEIVEHEEVYIDNPILIIISIRNEFFNFCYYVRYKNKIYKYE